MSEDGTKCEATFDFVVENFNKIEKQTVHSPSCTIRNLPWEISAKQVTVNSDSVAVKYLGVYLECDGSKTRESFWCSFAKVELMIVSQIEGVDNLVKKFKQLYSSKVVSMGFDDFIQWNNVINPEGRFIKDNKVILRAHVCIDSPQTVSWGRVGASNLLDVNTMVESNTNDTARFEATFDLVVKNFSSIERTARLCSPLCTIGNLPWNIKIYRTPNGDDNSSEGYLQFYIECNNNSTDSSWCCIAKVQLTVVSQKEGINDSKGNYRALFFSKIKNWGYPKFMKWNKLVDPESGFIIDDIVIVRAHVVVDNTLQSVSWGCIGSDSEQCNVSAMHITKKSDTRNDDAKSEATIHLILENFSKFKDPVYSLSRKIRSLPWKIKVTRQHENPADPSSKETLGFFLFCDEKSQNSSWSCFVNVQLMIVSLADDFNNRVQEFQHKFCPSDNYCGDEKFIAWNRPDRDYGFVKRDIIVLRAHVFADAPHGMNWDSKKETGFVGLMKENNTCFINSLLQTLFFIGQLRKAIYNLPTKSDNENFASILQKIFYELQTSNEPVSIENLVKFFQFEAIDLLTPYNMHEFLKTLFKKLENEMRCSSVENIIPDLFEGKIEHFIKCSDIEYECKTTESFSSIEFNIEEYEDMQESFAHYFGTELLIDKRKYDAGDPHGLQNAEKNTIFESFPPVLLIHLFKRFDYDHATGYCNKSNKGYAFYEKIDLDKYLKNPQSTPANYTLFAVLAHSGDPYSGHYVVFISPKCDGIWYEFDDEVVSICSKQAAIENNFRGNSKTGRVAHMLVYVRDSMFEHVLQDVPDNDIPPELKTRLQEEHKIKQTKREEHKKLYITIRVLLEDYFDGHQGSGLFDLAEIPDFLDKEDTLVRLFEVKKTTTIEEVLVMLSKSFGRPLDQMRIWPFTKKLNQSYRPMYFDVDMKRKRKISDFLTNTCWDIFLEMFPTDLGDYPLPLFNNETRVLLFFKLYEPKIRKIYYCEHSYFDIDSTLGKLILKLNEKAGYPPDTKLIIYKEVKARTLKKIVASSGQLKRVLKKLANGDIIVFQKDGVFGNSSNIEKHYSHL